MPFEMKIMIERNVCVFLFRYKNYTLSANYSLNYSLNNALKILNINLFTEIFMCT